MRNRLHWPRIWVLTGLTIFWAVTAYLAFNGFFRA